MKILLVPPNSSVHKAVDVTCRDLPKIGERVIYIGEVDFSGYVDEIAHKFYDLSREQSHIIFVYLREK